MKDIQTTNSQSKNNNILMSSSIKSSKPRRARSMSPFGNSSRKNKTTDDPNYDMSPSTSNNNKGSLRSMFALMLSPTSSNKPRISKTKTTTKTTSIDKNNKAVKGGNRGRQRTRGGGGSYGEEEGSAEHEHTESETYHGPMTMMVDMPVVPNNLQVPYSKTKDRKEPRSSRTSKNKVEPEPLLTSSQKGVEKEVDLLLGVIKGSSKTSEKSTVTGTTAKVTTTKNKNSSKTVSSKIKMNEMIAQHPSMKFDQKIPSHDKARPKRHRNSDTAFISSSSKHSQSSKESLDSKSKERNKGKISDKGSQEQEHAPERKKKAQKELKSSTRVSSTTQKVGKSSNIISKSKKQGEYTNKNDNKIDKKTTKKALSSKGKVSFANVEVRKYAIILGDHPDCQEGPPISIDWEYYQRNRCSIDKFESKRENHRRKQENLYIDPMVRERILKQHANVTDEDIAQVQKQLKPIKKQREKQKKLIMKLTPSTLQQSQSGKFFSNLKDIFIIG